MSVSVSDLQTRLAYRLGEDSAPSDTNETARRLSFFNEAQRKAIGEYDWWFLTDIKSLPSVDEQEIYSLDSTFREMLELRLDKKIVLPIPQSEAFKTYNYPPIYYQYQAITDRYFIFGDAELHILPIPSSTPAAASVTSITVSDTTATVTSAAAHGFSNHDFVTIAGASVEEYNGAKQITSVPSTTTFTYTVASGTATPASGTLLVTDRNIVYRFWKLVADMTTGNTVIPDRYADLLIAYAYARKVGTVEGMAGSSNEALAEYNEILKDMSSEENRKHFFNKSVTPTTMAVE